MPTQNAPASMYRTREGLGVWEHKGKVVAVGVGHSPTAQRWDMKPETSVGAWAIRVPRKAIEGAGVSPDQVDGLVMDNVTTTGAYWLDRTIPEDFLKMFQSTNDPLDGIAQLSAEWILKNMGVKRGRPWTSSRRISPTMGRIPFPPAGATSVADAAASGCTPIAFSRSKDGRGSGRSRKRRRSVFRAAPSVWRQLRGVGRESRLDLPIKAGRLSQPVCLLPAGQV